MSAPRASGCKRKLGDDPARASRPMGLLQWAKTAAEEQLARVGAQVVETRADADGKRSEDAAENATDGDVSTKEAAEADATGKQSEGIAESTAKSDEYTTEATAVVVGGKQCEEAEENTAKGDGSAAEPAGADAGGKQNEEAADDATTKGSDCSNSAANSTADSDTVVRPIPAAEMETSVPAWMSDESGAQGIPVAGVNAMQRAVLAGTGGKLMEEIVANENDKALAVAMQSEEVAAARIERDSAAGSSTTELVKALDATMEGIAAAEETSTPAAASTTAAKPAEEETPTASMPAQELRTITAHKSTKVVACSPRYIAVGANPKPLSGITPAIDFRGKSWMLVTIEASQNIDVASLYTQLQLELRGATQGFAVALEFPTSAVAVVAKEKFKVVNLKLDGYKFKTFSIGQGTAKRAVDVVTHVLTHCIGHQSSLKVVKANTENMSMEQAYAEVEHLSSTEFAQMVGDAKMKEYEDRSALEKLLVRCEAQLKVMRSKADRARALIREVGAEDPPVLPFHRYIGLAHLVGSALDPVSGQPVTANYIAYISKPELHMKYTACLIGPAGHGKTPLAKSTCVYFAVSYQGKFYGTPPEKCYYLQCNTADMLKEFNQGGVLRSWTPLFMDEFEAADTRQQGIMGENSLKVLTDVWEGGTIRARYHDIIIPPQVPRVFAANVRNSEEWLQQLGANEEHRAAILKRVMFFDVTTNLIPEELRSTKAAQIDASLRDALQAGLDFMG